MFFPSALVPIKIIVFYLLDQNKHLSKLFLSLYIMYIIHVQCTLYIYKKFPRLIL